MKAKTFLLILLVIFTACTASAQEKKNKTGGSKDLKTFSIVPDQPSKPGKLIVNDLLPDVVIEQHLGRNIVITREGAEIDRKGMTAVGKPGRDNTGLGLQIREVNNTIEIIQVGSKPDEGIYTILVPSNFSVHVMFKNKASGNIEIKNMSNEIEIKALSSDLKLSNITGPAVLYAENGDIHAQFSKVIQKSPISVGTVDGDINILLPVDTPADIRLSAAEGQVYSDWKLENSNQGSANAGAISIMNAKVNGGGVDIAIHSILGSVTLRRNK